MRSLASTSVCFGTVAPSGPGRVTSNPSYCRVGRTGNSGAQERLLETGVGVGGDREPTLDRKDCPEQGTFVIHLCICSDHHCTHYDRTGEQGEGKRERQMDSEGQIKN